ncbi:Uncharacterised protein [Mycobacteroides abscessus subsp. abscessus]|nr:Uncharacterised protein [Mycobacteroides abscessus subsp. abscessus]SHV82851.1 Uncharacterised protein [Mycobacteroides abscessus subsp. abscessus]SHV84889.1 Uncharacterised protein [Mycobacteroides abscessus subsp. abscessus]SHW55747.1 Uncharacterised protein [Mycobacteroides abscessus subsp. abscessus]SHX84403.1 Uncharacterised protein [Mycobacteroides abscessus subsp. abscessus]
MVLPLARYRPGVWAKLSARFLARGYLSGFDRIDPPGALLRGRMLSIFRLRCSGSFRRRRRCLRRFGSGPQLIVEFVLVR